MEKIVYVFDASTLILLAKVTLLRYFAEINVIVIVDKVKKEIFVKKEADDTKIIKALLEAGLIKENKQEIFTEKLIIDFGLGQGEGGALALALKEKSILATDDWKAIKTCKTLDIKFVTAIHCLLTLHKNKKIDTKLALEKIKNLEKYGRYNAQMIKDAINLIQGDENG